jgi:hypothetical protein
MTEPTEQAISAEVSQMLALEKSLEEREAALMANEQFRDFLLFQKDTTTKIASFWKTVEAQMIEHDIKSIKGEWGTLTIAERIGWDFLDDLLPAKFWKKVPDLKKMTDHFRLEGKPPKGATPKYTKYLTRRIKGREVDV